MFGPDQQRFVQSVVSFSSNVTFSKIDAPLPPNSTEVVLVGTKTALKSDAFGAALPPVVASSRAVILKIVEAASDKSTTTIPVVQGDSILTIIVAVVPEKCSRNNCATRPEAITSMLRGLKLHDNSRIYYASTSPTAQTSVASAIAKTFSRFTCKSGASEKQYLSKAPTVDVVFVGVGAIDTEGLNNLATFTQLAMFLGDAPPNLLTTTTFAEIAKQY
eukprot:PhF_6_TR2334/c0_g1_i4/m.4169